MKIIHTSDWHLGKVVNEYSMLEDQRFFLHKLIDFLVAERADALIIAGDLFDRSVPSAEAVDLADEILCRIVKEAGIPVLAVAGNHDSPERLTFVSRLYEQSGLYVEGNIKDPVRRVDLSDQFGPVSFYLLPYLEPAGARALYPDKGIRTFDDAYRAVCEEMLQSLDTSRRNVLVAHGFFSYLREDGRDYTPVLSESEVSVGGSDLVNARLFDPFDYVALGHLHAPQKLGKDTIRYGGSLLKYSVDEASQKKSVAVIELKEKGETALSFTSLRPRRDLRVVTGTVEELCKKENQAGLSLDDYVFAKLTDKQPVLDAVGKLRTVFPNIMGLSYEEYRPEHQKLLSSREIRSQTAEELFYKFYEDMTGEPLNSRQEEIIQSAVRDAQREEEAR